jgi:hypothetical protein
MSNAAAVAVNAMDQQIADFVAQHGASPKGIMLGTEVIAELKNQGRIHEQPVNARLTTDRLGESPYSVDWGTWPILDNATFVHSTRTEWGIILPTRP